MQRWWKPLALSAGILASLGGIVPSAEAQFMPPGSSPFPPGMMGPPPGMPYGGPPPGMPYGGPPPGDPGAMIPAEFPNPAKPSGEPVSPFSVREGGMPNAFNECNNKVLDPGYLNSDSLIFGAEYLLWRVRSGPLAVPVATTTNSLTLASIGQLGNPNTTVLLDSGTNAVDYKNMSGFRLTASAGIGFLPPIEFTGFYFNKSTTVYSVGSLSNPTQYLAVPFLDTEPGVMVPSVVAIAIPTGSIYPPTDGTITVTSQLRFWGAEANSVLQLSDENGLKLSLFGGYRFMSLEESLSINTVRIIQTAQTQTPFFGNFFSPGQFGTTTHDNFATSNIFNGGQIGVRGVYSFGAWSLFGDLKVAAGVTTERLNINGSSSLVPVGSSTPTQTVPGGIFALPTNSGIFSTNTFAIVPEAKLSLSYQINENIRFFGGYDALYWSRVTRPGDALSNALDSRQIPINGYTAGVTYNGPAPPSIVQRSFYAQGLFIGLEFGF